MEPNTQRAEAERWLGISAKLLANRDLVGSRSFAIRAREADPTNPISDQILAVVDTLMSAEKRVINSSQYDWYSILQLSHLVRDPDLIASHYRRLVLLLNPDHNHLPFADYALRVVVDAWSVLSDPTKKWMYDSELSVFLQRSSAPPDPEPIRVDSSAATYQFFQQPPPQQQAPAPSQHQQWIHHLDQPQLQERQLFQQQHHHQPQPQPPPAPPPQQQHQWLPQSQLQQLLPEQQRPSQPQWLPQPPQPPPPPPQQPQWLPEKQRLPEQQRLTPQPQPKEPQTALQFRRQQPQQQQQQPQKQQKNKTPPPPPPPAPAQKTPPPPAPPAPAQKTPPPPPPPAPAQKTPPPPPPPAPAQKTPPPPSPRAPAQKTPPPPPPPAPAQKTPPHQPPRGPPQHPPQQPQRLKNDRRTEEGNGRANNVTNERVTDNGNKKNDCNNSGHKMDNVNSHDGGDQIESFWTTCPYCYYIYEYPKTFQECILRCQNCRRAFQAIQIPNPPHTDADASFCSWSFFPIGFSMNRWKKSMPFGCNANGFGSNWVPFSPLIACPVQEKKKKVWRTVDEDDDDFDLSVSSDDSDSSDDWDSMRKKAKKGNVRSVRGRVGRKSNAERENLRPNEHSVEATGGADGENSQRMAEMQRNANHGVTGTKNDVTGKAVASGSLRKQMGKGVRGRKRLDLNVEFSNEVEDHAPVTRDDNGEEVVGFFEGLDEFLSSLPILHVVGDDKAKPS